jgi:hypothetical protein
MPLSIIGKVLPIDRRLLNQRRKIRWNGRFRSGWLISPGQDAILEK